MRVRRLGLCIVAAVTLSFVGVFSAVPGVAGADTTFTWSGGSASSMNWSDAQNWGGVSAPTNGASNLDLTFPTLSGCVPPDACQTGTNDLTGLGLNSLSFTGTPFSAPYTLGGQAVTLGSGGISSPVSAALSMPIQLTAPQSWTI